MGAIVAIGVALLLTWRILTFLYDKKEYARFINDTQNAKWANVSESNQPVSIVQHCTSQCNPVGSSVDRVPWLIFVSSNVCFHFTSGQQSPLHGAHFHVPEPGIQQAIQVKAILRQTIHHFISIHFISIASFWVFFSINDTQLIFCFPTFSIKFSFSTARTSVIPNKNFVSLIYRVINDKDIFNVRCPEWPQKLYQCHRLAYMPLVSIFLSLQVREVDINFHRSSNQTNQIHWKSGSSKTFAYFTEKMTTL